MPNVWDADVDITEELVCGLLQSQFPSLKFESMRKIGEGWDNSAWLIDETWLFRFPRRAIAEELIENEIKILPLLAPHLPLPIPVPQYVGQPQGDYPYPFAGYKFLNGHNAWSMDWSEDQLQAAAPVLARFLKGLHSIELTDEQHEWAPRDQLRRADFAFRLERARTRLESVETEIDTKRVLQEMESLLDTKRSEQLNWIHGDLHPSHILANEEGQLTGVIDWGDVHYGDPSYDLSIAFTFLPLAARQEFIQTYGNDDPELWKRARFHALHYGTVFLHYGQETRDANITTKAEAALRLSLALS